MGQEQRNLESPHIRSRRILCWALGVIVATLLTFPFVAEGGIGTPLPRIQEDDGSPKGVFTKLIFANDSLYRDGTHAHVSTRPSDALDLTYLKLDASNDPLTGQLDAGANGFTTTGTIGDGVLTISDGWITNALLLDTVEIYNDDGNLKIIPDVQGDVDFFGDTDVADDAIGKSLYLYRMAVEGDTNIRLHIDDERVGQLDVSTQELDINAAVDLGAYAFTTAGNIAITSAGRLNIKVDSSTNIKLGAAEDATIGFTGSQLQVISDGVTATDGLLLRGGTNGIAFNIGATEEALLTATTLDLKTNDIITTGKGTFNQLDAPPVTKSFRHQSYIPVVTADDVETPFTFERVSTPLTTPTSNADNDCLHPDVVYIPNGWNSYRYWMVMTPFAGADTSLENPEILVSNDGESWSDPGTNPLDGPPPTGVYSDPCLMFYQNTLYCYWRELDTGDGDRIHMMSSTNGVDWAAKVTVLDAGGTTTNTLLSPIVRNVYGTFYMWVVNNDASPRDVVRYSSTTPDGTFASGTNCTLTNNTGAEIWHVHHLWDGDAFYGIWKSDNHLYFAKSYDGLNWDLNGVEVFTGGGAGTWDETPYQTAVIKRPERNYFDVFYSAISTDATPLHRIGRGKLHYPPGDDGLVYGHTATTNRRYLTLEESQLRIRNTREGQGSFIELESKLDTTTAGCDPRIIFRYGATPASKWTMGYDCSTDTFNLGQATLNANTTLSIDTNGNWGINGATPDANVGVIIQDGSGEILRLVETSATGSPYLSFYQTTTKRSFIQHQDTNDNLIIASEYGDISLKTASDGSEVTRVLITETGDSIFTVNAGLDKIELVSAGTDQTKIIFDEGGTNVWSIFYDGTGSGNANTLNIRSELGSANRWTIEGTGDIVYAGNSMTYPTSTRFKAVSTGDGIMYFDTEGIIQQRQTAGNTIFRIAKGVGGTTAQGAGFYITNDHANPSTSANSDFGMWTRPDQTQLVQFVAATAGRQVIFTDITNRLLDHGHAVQDDPTIFIHSATALGVADTQWLSLTHDKTDGIIDVGLGFIKMADQVLFTDKAVFTQIDGDEYIDSLADGFMDYGATTAHRFLADVKLTGDSRSLYQGISDDYKQYWDGDDQYFEIPAETSNDGFPDFVFKFPNANGNSVFYMFDSGDNPKFAVSSLGVLYNYAGAILGDGGSANYLTVSSTGVVTMTGSAKRDLTLRADLDYTAITAQGKPTQVSVGAAHGYSMPIYNADNEEMFFNENVPGRWDGASDISFHILVALAAVEDADDNFKFQWSWNQVGETDIVPNATHDVTDEITVVDGTQNATYMLEFTMDYDVDAGDAVVAHDDLFGRLRRVDATDPDITGEVIVLDWHTHYTVDKMFKAP